MKIRQSFRILGLLLVAAAVITSPALKAQDTKKSDPKAMEILAKMIDAMGGRKAMEAVKDTTVSGTMEMVSMGFEGTLSLYNKNPNMMRVDVEVAGMSITQAFDGENAWWFNPQIMSNEDMPDQMGEDFRREAWGDQFLLYPEKHNVIYTYSGTEAIEGKDYHVLVQTHSDGWAATMFIDPGTFLSYKSKAKGTDPMMGGEIDIETFTSDYKKVDGLMVPHTMVTYQNGEEFMIIAITDVKFNTGLEDSFFKKQD